MSKNKKLERERKQQQKQKKHATESEKTPDNKPPFSSSSSLGKADSRAQMPLPNSPNRQSHVIGTIISKLSPSKRAKLSTLLWEKQLDVVSLTIHANNALSPQTLEAINAFYQRDNISRMCPGKNECISVKDDDGIRTNKQK